MDSSNPIRNSVVHPTKIPRKANLTQCYQLSHPLHRTPSLCREDFATAENIPAANPITPEQLDNHHLFGPLRNRPAVWPSSFAEDRTRDHGQGKQRTGGSTHPEQKE